MISTKKLLFLQIKKNIIERTLSIEKVDRAYKNQSVFHRKVHIFFLNNTTCTSLNFLKLINLLDIVQLILTFAGKEKYRTYVNGRKKENKTKA